jgi:hypothetical protein
MTDLHAADDHATPLTPAEREDLIPTHITLRSELNELEQQNIATGNRWAFAACSSASGAGRENTGQQNAISVSLLI